jgi:hypothetical protein
LKLGGQSREILEDKNQGCYLDFGFSNKGVFITETGSQERGFVHIELKMLNRNLRRIGNKHFEIMNM